jgi:hypothetical protein
MACGFINRQSQVILGISDACPENCIGFVVSKIFLTI